MIKLLEELKSTQSKNFYDEVWNYRISIHITKEHDLTNLYTFSLQATYSFNDNFDVTPARPTIETTLIPTPYKKGDDLIIIPSTQTLSVQQVTNSTLKVYVRKKRVRKESIYLRSPYIGPKKKFRMLVAFEVKPSIELNDTLALKRWMAQVDIIEP